MGGSNLGAAVKGSVELVIGGGEVFGTVTI